MADKQDSHTTQLYVQFRDALRTTNRNEINIILGDFNAKVEYGTAEKVVGKYDLDDRNDREDMLAQFCLEKEYVIKNIYGLISCHIYYIWKSPRENGQYIVHNHIDYMLINKKYQNSIKRVAAYPGDIRSDHNPLIGTLKFKEKRIISKNKNKVYDISLSNTQKRKMKDKDIRHSVIRTIKVRIWRNIKDNIHNDVVKLLGYKKRVSRKEWMTLGILDRRKKGNI